MADQLHSIVQRMIDAGESEDNIATVIQHFKAQGPMSGDAAAAREQERTAAQAPHFSGVGDMLTSFGKSLLPSTEPSDYLEGPKYALQHPIDSAKLVGGAILGGHVDQAKKAYADLSSMDPRRLSEGVGHAAAAMLPVVGPAAAHAGETIGSGDIAGGLGEAGAVLAPFAAAEGSRALRGKLIKAPSETIQGVSVDELRKQGVGEPSIQKALEAERAQRSQTATAMRGQLKMAPKPGAQAATPMAQTRTVGNLALKAEPMAAPAEQAVGNIDVLRRESLPNEMLGADEHDAMLAAGKQAPVAQMEARLTPQAQVRSDLINRPDIVANANTMQQRAATVARTTKTLPRGGGAMELPPTEPPTQPPTATGKPRLDAVQVARMLRDQYGAEEGARMLYGKKTAGGPTDILPAAERTARLKELASKSTLPNDARAGIDQAVAGLSPEDAKAYYAKGNPMAKKYMKFAHRDLFGNEQGIGRGDLIANPYRAIAGIGGELLARKMGLPPFALGAAAYMAPEIATGVAEAATAPTTSSALRAAILARLAAQSNGATQAGASLR